jgi:hypothetical protein
MEAGSALGDALAAARSTLATDCVLPPLRRGYDQLRKGAETLPGFEMVAFTQGCCALHQRRAES